MQKLLSSTKFLTLGLPIIGLLVLILGSAVGRMVFGDTAASIYTGTVAAISVLLAIVGSIFVVLRKEISRGGDAPSIRGFWAAFWGALSFVLLAGVEFYLISLILADLR